MESLIIVGSEGDTLIVATEAGQRFALPIDATLRRELKRHDAEPTPQLTKATPREIQAHIRSGLSSEEVAQLLDTPIEDVERYQGPVLAEREHIVSQALAVPVLAGNEIEPDGTFSFATAIRMKLTEAEAHGERWTSWKDEAGWLIKLEFTASDIEHDARWRFDPKRGDLEPINNSAQQLSRLGNLPDGIIPKLKAVDSVSSFKDDSRFDSGAFGPRRMEKPESEPAAQGEANPPSDHASDPSSSAPLTPRLPIVEAAIKRAPEEPSPFTDTEDLLEALRRRRGQREHGSAPKSTEMISGGSPLQAQERSESRNQPVALFEAGETVEDEAIANERREAEQLRQNEASVAKKKGRTSMPSWDEIVFGAKTED